MRPTSTPPRPTTDLLWRWAWAWPGAPTRGAWRSMPSRSPSCSAEAPDENIVLLRPDTVPEDIAMIARVSAHPHGPRRRHVARRRDGQAAGQDGRGRLHGPRGDRARGLGASRRGRIECGRLAVHRRAHRQHLPGPHPDAARPEPPPTHAEAAAGRRLGATFHNAVLWHSDLGDLRQPPGRASRAGTPARRCSGRLSNYRSGG